MRCPCICAGGRPADPLFISRPHRTKNLIKKLHVTNVRISWLYLVFFNGLWVVFPAWILWEAYSAMSSAMSQAEMVDLVNYLKKDD
jgi:hypothetical protein